MLRKLNFPLSALILGYVLGEMMESSLRRALSISQGDLGIPFSRPDCHHVVGAERADGGAAADVPAAAQEKSKRVIMQTRPHHAAVLLLLPSIGL